MSRRERAGAEPPSEERGPAVGALVVDTGKVIQHHGAQSRRHSAISHHPSFPADMDQIIIPLDPRRTQPLKKQGSDLHRKVLGYTAAAHDLEIACDKTCKQWKAAREKYKRTNAEKDYYSLRRFEQELERLRHLLNFSHEKTAATMRRRVVPPRGCVQDPSPLRKSVPVEDSDSQASFIESLMKRCYGTPTSMRPLSRFNLGDVSPPESNASSSSSSSDDEKDDDELHAEFRDYCTCPLTAPEPCLHCKDGDAPEAEAEDVPVACPFKMSKRVLKEACGVHNVDAAFQDSPSMNLALSSFLKSYKHHSIWHPDMFEMHNTVLWFTHQLVDFALQRVPKVMRGRLFTAPLSKEETIRWQRALYRIQLFWKLEMLTDHSVQLHKVWTEHFTHYELEEMGCVYDILYLFIADHFENVLEHDIKNAVTWGAHVFDRKPPFFSFPRPRYPNHPTRTICHIKLKLLPTGRFADPHLERFMTFGLQMLQPFVLAPFAQQARIVIDLHGHCFASRNRPFTLHTCLALPPQHSTPRAHIRNLDYFPSRGSRWFRSSGAGKMHYESFARMLREWGYCLWDRHEEPNSRVNWGVPVERVWNKESVRSFMETSAFNGMFKERNLELTRVKRKKVWMAGKKGYWCDESETGNGAQRPHPLPEVPREEEIGETNPDRAVDPASGASKSASSTPQPNESTTHEEVDSSFEDSDFEEEAERAFAEMEEQAQDTQASSQVSSYEEDETEQAFAFPDKAQAQAPQSHQTQHTQFPTKYLNPQASPFNPTPPPSPPSPDDVDTMIDETLDETLDDFEEPYIPESLPGQDAIHQKPASFSTRKRKRGNSSVAGRGGPAGALTKLRRHGKEFYVRTEY